MSRGIMTVMATFVKVGGFGGEGVKISPPGASVNGLTPYAVVLALDRPPHIVYNVTND